MAVHVKGNDETTDSRIDNLYGGHRSALGIFRTEGALRPLG